MTKQAKKKFNYSAPDEDGARIVSRNGVPIALMAPCPEDQKQNYANVIALIPAPNPRHAIPIDAILHHLILEALSSQPLPPK